MAWIKRIRSIKYRNRRTKMKLKELLEQDHALKSISSFPLPFKIKFKVAKILKKLSVVIEPFNEMRDEALRELASKHNLSLDPSGQGYILTEEAKNEIDDTFTPELNKEQDIKFEPLSIEDLEDIEKFLEEWNSKEGNTSYNLPITLYYILS